MYVLGQCPNEQSSISSDGPLQSAPFTGTGFVHDLDLVLVPFPHETLQADQSVHSLQPPSTIIIMEI